MSDTLIFPRNPVQPTPAAEPAAPARLRPFSLKPDVEVLEAAPTNAGSILDIINALLAKESVSKEELVALRARLRRYASQVNVMSSLLARLLDQRTPAPAPSSTSRSLAPSTSSSCHIA